MAGAKQVVGWVEHASITPGELSYTAKLDTGAKTTSLHCIACTVFTREGKEWVRLEVTDRHGKGLVLERPILRWVSVKRHATDAQRRPVIRLGICLASVYKETDVNLIDRQQFKYELLIGREFLQGEFLVDPGAEFLTRPACK